MRRLIDTHLVAGLQFLAVGGVAFLVDYLCYNLLVFGAPWPGHEGVLFDYPVPAKITAIAVASVVTYVGNKLWTFGARKSKVTGGRLLAFIVLNVVAMGLQLGCLGFSRYVLGLHTWLADNISGTLIGQALATIFRYFTYRRWVFPDDASNEEPAQIASTSQEGLNNQ